MLRALGTLLALAATGGCGSAKTVVDLGDFWAAEGQMDWLQWSSDGATLYYVDVSAGNTLKALARGDKSPRVLMNGVENPVVSRRAEDDRLFSKSLLSSGPPIPNYSLHWMSLKDGKASPPVTIAPFVSSYLASLHGDVIVYADARTGERVIVDVMGGARRSIGPSPPFAFSPDGRWLLTADADGYGLIDVATGATEDLSVPAGVKIGLVTGWEGGKPRVVIDGSTLVDLVTGERRSLLPPGGPQTGLLWAFSGDPDRPTRAYSWTVRCEETVSTGEDRKGVACARSQAWLNRGDLGTGAMDVVAASARADPFAATLDGTALAIFESPGSGSGVLYLKQLQ